MFTINKIGKGDYQKLWRKWQCQIRRIQSEIY